MGFDDLAAFFLVMREQVDDEMAMLTFEAMKKNKEAEELKRDDLLFYCKMAQSREIYVNDFYRDSKLDFQDAISIEQFKSVWPLVKKINFMKFAGNLILGY